MEGYALVHEHGCGKSCRPLKVYLTADQKIVVQCWCSLCKVTWFCGYNLGFIAEAFARLMLGSDQKLIGAPEAAELPEHEAPALSDEDRIELHGMGVKDEVSE
jgi:hypothetical protein